MSKGYYRFPTIHSDTIIFTSEDDLWSVPRTGGIARRLTSGVGECTRPYFSPDGRLVAFSGKEEGNQEVYVMASVGGAPKRVTFMGGMVTNVCGWSRDGKKILFVTNAAQPFLKLFKIFEVHLDGGLPREMPYGHAHNISFGKTCTVIGRNTIDPARWKRYKGGTAGDIWVDKNDSGTFKRLITMKGNIGSPLCVGDRIYFIADHEGVGNIYSCTPEGKALRRETDHDEYYVRNASTDGKSIVYHAGGDLFVYDGTAKKSSKVDITYHSPVTQSARKYVAAAKFIDLCAIHPKGHSLAMTVRGKAFTMANWEGAVLQHGASDGVRYRFPCWLNDGKRLVMLSDESGEESLEIHSVDPTKRVEKLPAMNFGRALSLVASPKFDQIALSNHRNELVFVDLKTKKMHVVDRSVHNRISGISFSPDGKWIAYGFAATQQTSCIKLYNVTTKKTREATKPVLHDGNPSFDPEGKYLYFISHREFDPVYDNLHFDLGFPSGMRPYLLTLAKETPSPFVPKPHAPVDELEKKLPKHKEENFPETKIDFEGISDRVLAFPVPEGKYGEIIGVNGKVLFSSFPVEGSMSGEEAPMNGVLEMYDFTEQKKETVATGIGTFKISRDRSTLIYSSSEKIRVMKAGIRTEPRSDNEPPSRASGWIDLSRVKVSVNPRAEWRQMYREAWRLQRDHFWTADMCGVDWNLVHKRYMPLLERIASRSEFSDLMWEMQGELGTSHAYEMGGDYRKQPLYALGLLGADFSFDEKTNSYTVKHIVRGDSWNNTQSSPLAAPGININEGDRLISIGTTHVDKNRTPNELLVNQAGSETLLTFALASGEKKTVTVKALRDEQMLRYREWVETNRAYVHKKTNGRVGYVHIPNMGPWGYSEFHRGYLSEVGREALIVDVRYNGGGHVSQLILEKLNRKRIGYDLQRWGEPQPYPSDSVLGPIVAITNELAGSDGDIFSHCFKLYKIGPLIGKRTWGGVIGIWPRHSLVDGSVTTQPEFSFWFQDVGWSVENYGTDPDIDVDIAPQDYARGHDPQLDRSLEEIGKLMKKHPPKLPVFPKKPNLALPKLKKINNKN